LAVHALMARKTKQSGSASSLMWQLEELRDDGGGKRDEGRGGDLAGAAAREAAVLAFAEGAALSGVLAALRNESEPRCARRFVRGLALGV